MDKYPVIYRRNNFLQDGALADHHFVDAQKKIEQQS